MTQQLQQLQRPSQLEWEPSSEICTTSLHVAFTETLQYTTKIYIKFTYSAPTD